MYVPTELLPISRSFKLDGWDMISSYEYIDQVDRRAILVKTLRETGCGGGGTLRHPLQMASSKHSPTTVGTGMHRIFPY